MRLAWNLVVPLKFFNGCEDGSVRVWEIYNDDGGNVLDHMLLGHASVYPI